MREVLFFAAAIILASQLFGSASGDSVMANCKRARVDVVIVLDSSFSVGPTHWKMQLKFLENLVMPFTVGKTHARFAIVVFNTNIKYVIGLTNRMSKAQLRAKIRTLKYSIGLTFTGEALMKAEELIKTQGRKNAKKLVILVTDGKSNGWYNPVPVARHLKREKVMIITVGITHRINKKELDNISTSGHFIAVKQFKQLAGYITKLVQRKTCRSALVRVCKRQKSDLTFILDSSTSIGPDHWRQTLRFVERLTDPLFIGKRSGRVALMTFNTEPHLQFLYKKYLDKVLLLKKGIRNVVFTEGLTFMGEALRFFHINMYPAMRRRASKIVVLITDGYANGQVDVLKEARKLKKLGVNFITVGVTNKIDRKRLLKISSSHKLYYANKFSKLKEIISDVQGEVCRDITK